MNSGRFPRDWITTSIALAYTGYLSYAVTRLLETPLTIRLRTLLIAGWLLVVLTCALVVLLVVFRRGDRLYKLLEQGARWVQVLDRRVRGLFYLALMVSIATLSYTYVSRGLMENKALRMAVLLALIVVAVQFWPFQAPRSWGGRFLITLLGGAFSLLSGDYLQYAVNYPFSLHWSEGNRLYDYSLIFGKGLYQYDGNLSLPYYAPGRYGLWGIWFLIPGLPISFHRFWNATLWIVPPILLGWLLARSLSRQPGVRLGVALWLGLFLSQGPIYAPILLVASLLVAFDRSKTRERYIAIGVASLYAGLSRWTWFGAAGAWGALSQICAAEVKPRQPHLKRYIQIVWVIIVGSLPGILANWTQFFSPKDIAFPLSQPKLWYRLFPNSTYPLGIIPGLALACGPLLVILIWLVSSRRFKLGKLQLVAIGGVMVVTLVAGLLASVKIGGGSNLHNLDMFFITLALIVMLYLDQTTTQEDYESFDNPRRSDDEMQQDESSPSLMRGWPYWAKAVMVVASLMLAWPYFSNVRTLKLPPQEDIQRSLDNLRLKIERYKGKGDILFLDQRQLLTFEVIKDIRLLPEYEKKYLMDQAMAGNAVYFQDFHNDLANKRFALIVSEPLFMSYDNEYDPFGEENNAWVKWVSEPVLCFYAPEKTYKEMRVQLLLPRTGTLDCALSHD